MRRGRRLGRGFVLSALVLWLLPSSGAQAGALSRQDVVQRALAAYPGVIAEQLRADAAHAAVAAQGGLDPVMVDVGVAPGMWMERPGVEITARWALPLWGMRGLSRSAAESGAAVWDAAARMSRAEVAALASVAVDDHLLATRRLTVLAHHRSVMEAAALSIGRRVAAGLAPPGAEAMARGAVLELDEQSIVARRDLAVADAALRALAGVAAADLSESIAPLGAPQGSDVPAPSVAMASAEADMRRAMADMARRAGRPMIAPMVGVNTMWPEAHDWPMVGVALSVPVDRSALRASRRSAELEHAAADASIHTAERTAARARDEAVAMRAMAEEMEALLVERTEPLAVERARLARSAWESGQAPVGEWLDAERDVFDARWRIAEARASRSRAVAMYTMLQGDLAGVETP